MALRESTVPSSPKSQAIEAPHAALVGQSRDSSLNVTDSPAFGLAGLKLKAAVGSFEFWRLIRNGAETPRVLRAVLPPARVVTVWLSVADHLAIREGIWRFGDGLHLGWRIGVVPVEEVLFFLVTNLLVVFGLALLDGLGQGGGRR